MRPKHSRRSIASEFPYHYYTILHRRLASSFCRLPIPCTANTHTASIP
ncbi:hypothetical protein HMPREF1508_0088 [Shuttleworthella sp. MSX8B]|nr:hypothetical protein HMPREF1508_0088 [Shuttleworthia sp. MSX8B]